jgi:hypothetical protein
MTVLRAAPFNLALDQLIVAKVRAVNVIGAGSYSAENTLGVTIQTEPQAPSSAPSIASYTQFTVTIAMPPYGGSLAGSSPILYYDLTWDAGTSGATWTSYTATSSSTVIITGLSSGASYQFKYRSQNIHGWGSYSSTASVTLMDLP